MQKKEQIRITIDNIIYSLNEEEKTAKIIKCISDIMEIFIPFSINHDSTEYVITSIEKCAFKKLYKVRSIKFANNSEIKEIKKEAFIASTIESIIIPPNVTKISESCFSCCNKLKTIEILPNSKLCTIEKNAFHRSRIESILIPQSLTELEEGWCYEVSYLNEIKIMSNNPRYSLYENNFIVTKSSSEKVDFDVLVFCTKNVTNVRIPDFIEIIGSYAFNQCKSLKNIEFTEYSKLRIIEKEAFSSSGIISFQIPTNLIKIGEFAFNHCYDLQMIEMPNDTRLLIIENGVFSLTESLEKLKEKVCLNSSNSNPRFCIYDNKFILEKTSPNKENFDKIVLSVRDIETVEIPNFIEIIGNYAFSKCYNLNKIEFPSDSKLRIIENGAFICTKIDMFPLPSHVKYIGKYVFGYNDQFKLIEIPENSELQVIEKKAFFWTLIERISIPSNLVDLKEGWCFDTPYLKSLNIMPNNPLFITFDDGKFILAKSNKNNVNYDDLVIAKRDIKTAIIPSFIKAIRKGAFEKCHELKCVKFLDDSELQVIKSRAFSYSSIEYFFIPQNLIVIEKYAFDGCSHLRKVIFPPNSKLQKLDVESFAASSITSFSIPSHVTIIGKNTFHSCKELCILEFNENSEIKYIDLKMFKSNKKVIIMIPRELSFYRVNIFSIQVHRPLFDNFL